MKALVLMALFGGDVDHATKFAEWVTVHPLVNDSDGGFHIGCANGNKPRMYFVNGEYHVTCEPRR